MLTTKYRLFTTKNKLSNNREDFIYQFMIKSGLIRKLSAGIYIWLPNGVRIINNIKNILQTEMNKIGAMEINLPILQPVDLWYKSNRFYTYGPELMQLYDRHNKRFVLSPTNEEIIAYLIERENDSSKPDLPIILYQITKKFRDERRPKFGVMRCKEFIMKDAYSFHITEMSLSKTYELMLKSYKRSLNKMKLNFYIVKADNGSIGGSLSHEFHVITNNGEDKIAISDNLHYIANLEIAKKRNILYKPDFNNVYWLKNRKKFYVKTKITAYALLDQIQHNDYLAQKLCKTIFFKIYKDNYCEFVAVMIKQSQNINIKKVLDFLKKTDLNISKANNNEITDIHKIHCNEKFFGPLGLTIKIIIDENIANINNFIVGANQDNSYFINVNWGRDISLSNKQIGDLCDVEKGDYCPTNRSKLNIKDSMEIAHIFQLGNKYLYKDRSLYMGCYGIGINRLIIALIEQHINIDKNSIILPISISPFQILILPINMYNSKIVYDYAYKLYKDLLNNNIEVLLDDRRETPGVMFHDMELIGIPYVVILSERHLKNDCIELKNRQDNCQLFLPIKTIIEYITKEIIDHK